jgi:hypothetical protein
MKPRKELIVNEILGEMDFGISYTECMRINESKWKLPEGTFVRYWKAASEIYLAGLEKDKQLVAEVREQVVKDRALNAIMSVEERKAILTQIGRGEIPLMKYIVCDGEIQQKEVVPTWRDRRDAVAELNKMEGDYAPLKKDITTNGDSIAPAPVFRIILDEDGEL